MLPPGDGRGTYRLARGALPTDHDEPKKPAKSHLKRTETMSDPQQVGVAAKPSRILTKTRLAKARWGLGGLFLGLLAGAWIGGGTDRYGESEGVIGGVRGGWRTMTRGFHFTAATVKDCMTKDGCSVRNLGLARQVENRLWQEKHLVADGIVVEVSEPGTAVLSGQVPDSAHKDRAVTLARDTRGVEKVVDQLAVAPAARTIEATPGAAVPTGVASGSQSQPERTTFADDELESPSRR
jgi:hypothetical protein